MMDNLNLSGHWHDLIIWGRDVFWTTNTLYQGILIPAAFVLASLLHKLVVRELAPLIEKAKAPYTAKRIYRNLMRLLLPLMTLIIISIGAEIVSVETIGIDITMTKGFTKVLLAWIIIRIAVQFIANAAIRNFFAFVIWSIAALSILGVLGQTTTMLDAIAFTVGDFRLSALAVIKSALMIFALLYVAVFISSFLERRIFQVKSLSRSSQVLIAKIIRVALIVFALLIGVTSAGIDLSLFTVFGGAIGLGIGFGLQKGISNLFSGMLLLIDQSIRPGDVIELENGTFGWVNSMAARYTEIVTRDNKSFLIPNEEFITQRVVNWSHGDSLIRLEVQFGVDYRANPHEVKQLAEECTKEAHERICKEPAPVCHLAEFGDSSLNFKLRFWIKDAEQGVTNIRGEVMLALWDMLKANNIQIPYPHRVIYMHNEAA